MYSTCGLGGSTGLICADRQGSRSLSAPLTYLKCSAALPSSSLSFHLFPFPSIAFPSIPPQTMTNAHRITLTPITHRPPPARYSSPSSSHRPPPVNGSPSQGSGSTTSKAPNRDVVIWICLIVHGTNLENPLALRITHSASRPSLSIPDDHQTHTTSLSMVLRADALRQEFPTQRLLTS